MAGSSKAVPNKDVTEIGLPARNYLRQHPNSFVILVDDLERDRVDMHQETFERYRAALDAVLPDGSRGRVSVQFLVHMIEAYYFADAAAVNAILGTALEDFDGDVEAISNPKARLRQLGRGFDEIADGKQIAGRLDLYKVLSNSDTCASLRTLVKWCSRVKGEADTDRFQLRIGCCSPVTGAQLDIS